VAETGGNVDQAQALVALAAPPLRGELPHRVAALESVSENTEQPAWAAVLPFDVDDLDGAGTPVIVIGLRASREQAYPADGRKPRDWCYWADSNVHLSVGPRVANRTPGR
jgi:hypothetical protein